MANLVELRPQAKILFSAIGPSGASAGIAGAVDFTPEGLLHGSGWKSDVWDFGTGDRPGNFTWRATLKTVDAVDVGAGCEIYLVTSDDNNLWDANLGSGNRSLSYPDKRLNAQFVGSVLVDDSSASGTRFTSSGQVNIQSRYISVCWWNFTGSQLTTSDGDGLFELVPCPDVIGDYF